jgi:hypothetical protein
MASRSGPPNGELARTNPIIAAVIMMIAALRSDFMITKYLSSETRCSSFGALRNIPEIN